MGLETPGKDYVVKVSSITTSDLNEKINGKSLAIHLENNVVHECQVLNAWNKENDVDFHAQITHVDKTDCSIEKELSDEDKENLFLLGPNGKAEKLIFLTQPYVPGLSAEEMILNLHDELSGHFHNADSEKALLTLHKGMMILLAVLKELRKFYKTKLVHGDAWLRNFHIQLEPEIKANILDFDGSFKPGINVEQYKTMFPILGNGMLFTAQELPVKMEQANAHLSQERILNHGVDLHSVFGHFIWSFLFYLPGVLKQNLDLPSALLDSCQQISSDFIIWSIANVCNSPKFTDEFLKYPLIHQAIQARENVMSEHNLAYHFKSADTNKIIDILENCSELNAITPKNKYELMLTLQKVCSTPAVNREFLLEEINSFIKIKLQNITPKNREKILLQVRASLANEFSNGPLEKARVSLEDAINHVEKVNKELLSLIEQSSETDTHGYDKHF